MHVRFELIREIKFDGPCVCPLLHSIGLGLAMSHSPGNLAA